MQEPENPSEQFSGWTTVNTEKDFNLEELSKVFAAIESGDTNRIAEASRSVDATIKNETAITFRFVERRLSGGVINDPETTLEIPPGREGRFHAESNGVGTGTEGFVFYEDKNNPSAPHLSLYFNNPFIGGNSYGGGPNPYRVAVDGGGGNNAHVKFIVR